nr:hypothetical protein [Corynebacterium aurimucosum]
MVILGHPNGDPTGFSLIVDAGGWLPNGLLPAVIVQGADIITTCTADKAQNQILAERHVLPGVHLNAVGGDCPGKTELESSILDKSKVFVEFPEQTRIEGEIQQKPEDFPVVEFYQVLTGQATGRDSEEQITLFDDVGFAINDFSALRYLRDSVRGTDLAPT